MQILKPPIAILGGTFDPVHNGHIEIAQHVLTELRLDCIEFMPNRQTMLKDTAQASPSQRLEMLRLAIQGNPSFAINPIEIEHSKASYTVDTLMILRKNLPHTPICFLLGTDSFNALNRWHQWETLLDYCHLIVAPRPGHEVKHEDWQNQLFEIHLTDRIEPLHQHTAGRIYLLDSAPIDIASSAIRQKIASGTNLSDQLPPAVWKYITHHHLYS